MAERRHREPVAVKFLRKFCSPSMKKVSHREVVTVRFLSKVCSPDMK